MRTIPDIQYFLTACGFSNRLRKRVAIAQITSLYSLAEYPIKQFAESRQVGAKTLDEFIRAKKIAQELTREENYTFFRR